MDFGFKKFPSINDRLALEVSRYREEANIPELIRPTFHWVGQWAAQTSSVRASVRPRPSPLNRPVWWKAVINMIPELMIKEKTTLFQKDLQKGTIPHNYYPIMCLPSMWKILTAQITEIYYSLVSCELFPEKQKECQEEQEEKVIYCTLIRTSSKRTKRGRKL